MASVLYREADYETAKQFLDYGIEMAKPVTGLEYYWAVFSLAIAMINLNQFNLKGLESGNVGKLIKEVEEGFSKEPSVENNGKLCLGSISERQKTHLSIYISVLKMSQALRNGDFKNSKRELKTLNEGYKKVSSGESDIIEAGNNNELDTPVWMTKEQICVLIYLLQVQQSCLFGSFDKTIKNAHKGLMQIEKLKNQAKFRNSQLLVDFETIILTLAFQANVASNHRRKPAIENMNSLISLKKTRGRSHVQYFEPALASMLSIYASSLGDLPSASKQMTRILILQDNEYQHSNQTPPPVANIAIKNKCSNELTGFAWMSYVLTQLQDWKNLDQASQDYVDSVMKDRLRIDTFGSTSKLLVACAHFVHSCYHFTNNEYDKCMESCQKIIDIIDSCGSSNYGGFVKVQTMCLVMVVMADLKQISNEKYLEFDANFKDKLENNSEDMTDAEYLNNPVSERVTCIAVNIVHAHILARKLLDKRMLLWVVDVLKNFLLAFDDLVDWKIVQNKVSELTSETTKTGDKSAKKQKKNMPEYFMVEAEFNHLYGEERKDKSDCLEEKVNDLFDWVEGDCINITSASYIKKLRTDLIERKEGEEFFVEYKFKGDEKMDDSKIEEINQMVDSKMEDQQIEQPETNIVENSEKIKNDEEQEKQAAIQEQIRLEQENQIRLKQEQEQQAEKLRQEQEKEAAVAAHAAQLAAEAQMLQQKSQNLAHANETRKRSHEINNNTQISQNSLTNSVTTPTTNINSFQQHSPNLTNFNNNNNNFKVSPNPGSSSLTPQTNFNPITTIQNTQQQQHHHHNNSSNNVSIKTPLSASTTVTSSVNTPINPSHNQQQPSSNNIAQNHTFNQQQTQNNNPIQTTQPIANTQQQQQQQSYNTHHTQNLQQQQQPASNQFQPNQNNTNNNNTTNLHNNNQQQQQHFPHQQQQQFNFGANNNNQKPLQQQQQSHNKSQQQQQQPQQHHRQHQSQHQKQQPQKQQQQQFFGQNTALQQAATKSCLIYFPKTMNHSPFYFLINFLFILANPFQNQFNPNQLPLPGNMPGSLQPSIPGWPQTTPQLDHLQVQQNLLPKNHQITTFKFHILTFFEQI